MSMLKIPHAPSSIQKGIPLKVILNSKAVRQLAENIHSVYNDFDKNRFIKNVADGIEPLTITERSIHIATSLKKYLPNTYSDAIGIILKSLTPPLEKTDGNGLAVLFYMPHCSYVATYGVNAEFNNGCDPFDISMNIQYELTQRFSCEFSIRPFIINNEKRTMDVLYKWMNDPNPHVRRLCSEGTRPRLPWSTKIDSFVKDPTPTIPILEHLKNDPNLYVRRSVANHVGDIAKDHLELVLNLCERWLKGASPELKWVIRHAVRNPIKKGNRTAIKLRKFAQ